MYHLALLEVRWQLLLSAKDAPDDLYGVTEELLNPAAAKGEMGYGLSGGELLATPCSGFSVFCGRTRDLVTPNSEPEP